MIQDISPQELRDAKLRVSSAWRRWEEENMEDPRPLRQALQTTQGQLDQWSAMTNGWLPQEARQLSNEIAVVEALILQQQQQGQRGF